MIVLFDLDGTLFDHDGADRDAALVLRAFFASETTEEEFLQRWRAAQRRHYRRYLSGEIAFSVQRRERIRETIDGGLSDKDADALFAFYFDAYRRAWRLYDDVASCLHALAGFKLGLITNGDGVVQRAKLATLGLAGSFDCVTISGECGVAKPDRRIFHLACATLGVPPDHAIYIGDDFVTDVQAAQAAGLNALWLDRSARFEGAWLTSLKSLPAQLAAAAA
jgi:putative hydrolase of the HAD superfamily